MPLVLTLRQGHGFYVGDTHVEVVSVKNPYEFTVQAEGGKPVQVGIDDWSNVMPGVDVQAGVPRNQEGEVVKAQIRAPGLKIVRYGSKHPHDDCAVCHGTKIMKVNVPCPVCHGHGCSKCNHGTVKQESTCPECH